MSKSNNNFFGAIIVYLCICIIVLTALILTHSLWSFLGFVFFPSYNDNKTCPKCGYDLTKDKDANKNKEE